MDALTYSMVRVFDGNHDENETFHEFTKLNRHNIHKLGARVGEIRGSVELQALLTRSWKSYADAPTVSLPPPDLGTMTLQDALATRRSVSSESSTFATGPVTLQQLGSVLAYSYGPMRELRSSSMRTSQHLRASPSAGALYPLEIYPLVFDCEGLPTGIYHYRVIDHGLEQIRVGSPRVEFLETTTYGELLSGAAVILVVTAMFHRTYSKYLQRGYRFLMNDVGALLQSFYLTGTALGLGTCAIGGFYDDELGAMLDVDNVNEAPVVCFALGQR